VFRMRFVCVSRLTDALATHVLLVADVALAPVAVGRQQAASVQTQVGEVFAHVNGLIHGDGACVKKNIKIVHCGICSYLNCYYFHEFIVKDEEIF